MPVMDEHVWVHAILDQLEVGFRNGDSILQWDAEAWAGTDAHRFWLKSEGEVEDGKIADGKQEAYYSRPISTYFDVQAGIRYDLDSRSGRGWAALGIEGLAPNFFHVSATTYASDKGHLAANLDGSFDLLLTQRLILQPQLEFNLYSKNDPARRIGSGLSNIETGLRLRYEISRKFAPYVGVSYERRFGQTRRYAIADGEETENLLFVTGLRMWF
jgi:copper resistance protein B